MKLKVQTCKCKETDEEETDAVIQSDQIDSLHAFLCQGLNFKHTLTVLAEDIPLCLSIILK